MSLEEILMTIAEDAIAMTKELQEKVLRIEGEREENLKDARKQFMDKYKRLYPNYPDLHRDDRKDSFDDWADQPERKAVLITATPKNGDEYHISQGMNIKYTEEFTFTPDGFTVKRKD